MRALGLALVIGSVALGAGGVAYTQEPAPSVEAQSAEPADAEQGMCSARRPPRAERVEVQLDRAGRARFVPLNGTGYNYSDPGVFRPEVPTRKSAAPPAAPDDAANAKPEAQP